MCVEMKHAFENGIIEFVMYQTRTNELSVPDTFVYADPVMM